MHSWRVGQILAHAIVFCQISFPPLPSPPPPLFFCPRTAKTRSGDEIRKHSSNAICGDISSVILLDTSSQSNSRGHASNITCPRIEYHMPKVIVEWNRAPTIIQNAFHAFRIKNVFTAEPRIKKTVEKENIEEKIGETVKKNFSLHT